VVATAVDTPLARGHRHPTPGRLLRPILALLIFGAAAVWWYQSGRSPHARMLVASGTIEADESEIAAEMVGRISAVLAQEGDVIAAGAPLIRLDDTLLASQVAQAESAVESARANHNLVVRGARAEEIRAARAAVNQAIANRQAAERAIGHARLARANPQELAARIAQAETAVVGARVRVAQVEAGPRAGDLGATRGARDQARANLDQLRATLAAQETVARAAVTASESRLALVRQGPRTEDIRALEVGLEQARNTRWATQIERDATCGRGAGTACDAANARVAATESAVSAAAPTLEKARNGALPEEVRVAESALSQARADLQARLEVSQPALAAAQAAHDAAHLRVADLESGATEQERQIALTALEAAERNLRDLRAMRDDPLHANALVDAAEGQASAAAFAADAAHARLDALTAGPTEEQVAVARAAVTQAEAVLRTASAQSARAHIAAPTAGTVTRLVVRPGEVVSPGVPLIALADLANLRLTLYVPEDQIGRITLGGDVAVSVDSFRGEAFAGEVTYISPRAEFTPRNVQTRSDRARTVFAVRVRLPNPDGRLKPGMYADATLAPAL